MIEFSCHCGHAFSVGDELAGGLVQCPACKRLNDIPGLGDLPDIDDQGIYKIDAPPPAPGQDPHRIEQLTTAFTREHFDPNGQPIDLRDSFADPIGPASLEPVQVGQDTSPKYDPDTGELIQSIDVKADALAEPQNLPVARRVLPSTPHTLDGIEIPSPAEALTIPARLFAPLNFMVMVFVFLAHLLGQAMMAAIGSFYLLLLPFWLALHGLILAHYANVIDETGPGSKGELPVPLRHLDWRDDTWGPFVRAIIAIVVCFGPALLVVYNSTPATRNVMLAVGATMAVVGLLLFPAALLTTTTSGSLLNLRPDRLIAVATICGLEYLPALLSCIAGAGLAIWGTTMTNIYSSHALGVVEGISTPARAWLLAQSAIIGGIYLLHAFCWQMGILYRKHYEQFPWLFQRHLRSRAGGPLAKGFPVRRARPPARAPVPTPVKSAPRVQPISAPNKRP